MKKIFLSLVWVVMFIGAYFVLGNMENKIRPITARIDISEKTANHVPCFNVKEKTTEKEPSLAEWMPKFGLQGYVIQKDGLNEELTITANEDNCRIDFSLRGPWKLKDLYDRSKGLKERWVEYTSFSINDKNIITKSVPAWHNKPIYHTVIAQKGEVLAVKIQWKKYYTSKQLKTKKLITLLELSLVLILCMICYKIRYRIYAIYQKMKNHQNFDLEEVVLNKWGTISPAVKKSFLWIFLITNIVFLFHTVQYMWGNHDWYLLKDGMPVYDMLWCSRFSGGLLQQVFGGDLLPIINNLFCFAGFAFAAVYLAKYWKIPQTPLVYTLFGLFIILMPYTLSWLWYIKQTTLYWNIFFVVFALYISQKKTYFSSIIAIIFMVISLGAYASVISTIAIVLLGRVLIDVIVEQKSIKELFRTYLRTAVNVLISVIIFKLILMYYESVGRIKHGDYNTDYIVLEDLPQKIKLALKACIEIFYVSQPYMSTPYKILLAFPVLYVVYITLKNKSIKAVQGILLLCLILFCGQLTNLMAKADFSYVMRVNFFSQPYIYALFIAIGLQGKKQIKSLCLIIMSIALWLNALSDIRYQKVHYLAYKMESQVYTDIVTRIKQSENFDANRSYVLVTTGPVARRPYFYNNIEDYNDDSVNNQSFSPQWNETDLYNFWENRPYMSRYIGLQRGHQVKTLTKEYTEQIAEFIFNKARPYPHKNSVYVDGKYIFVVYDENGLNYAKRNIQSRLQELEKTKD